MSIIAAVAESLEGTLALSAGIDEARSRSEDLVIFNLGLTPVDPSDVPAGIQWRVIEREGRGDRDPVDALLDEIADDPRISRVVIGLRRRSPMGKALLGSVSQRILLNSPVPVLSVRPDQPE